MHNSALINNHMLDAAARSGVPRYFFSSSVCVYRDMAPEEPPLSEADAYPAMPDNEYGWEKLYAERMALAYARTYPLQVRIARFENCYGPQGTWTGGREKAPAAICRKVAEAKDSGTVEVWGDGTAIRVFTYVDDLVDGIYSLMQSGLEGPVNLGSDERVTVADLVRTVIEVSGKRINVEYVPGPVGVHARNPSTRLRTSLQQGAHQISGLAGEDFAQRGDRADISVDRRTSNGNTTIHITTRYVNLCRSFGYAQDKSVQSVVPWIEKQVKAM